MPELPEVETIRLGLEKYLVGKKVESVEIRLQKLFEGDSGHHSESGAASKITGATVKGVRRFGKVLVIDFSNNYSLAVHVKLTGQLIFRSKVRKVQKVREVRRVDVEKLPNPFTHVIFHLDGDDKLFYNDIRQFGWLRVLHTPDVGKMKFIEELGPEPFGSIGSAQDKSAQGKPV